MSEIRFYHLTRSTVEQALPDLLEKTLARGWRAVVRMGQKAAVERLDAALWTYQPESFLPHGSAEAGQAEDQPVWLTTQTENPNKANVLFSLDGADAADRASFALVCDVFSGDASGSSEAAKDRQAHYRKEGHKVTYWLQTEKGWTNKSD